MRIRLPSTGRVLLAPLSAGLAVASTIAVVGLAASCGADMELGGAGDWAYSDGGTAGCFSSNDCPTGWSCSEFGTCVPPGTYTDGGTLPAEVEREFGEPQSTLRYVYVNMPELDEVAKIDGQTLAVAPVPVGDRPEVIATIPGGDDAVVLDRGSSTATIIRPTSASDARVTLATLPHLNVLSVAPSGAFAVAWFDLTRAVQEAGGIDAVAEIGSFQDVTILALGRGAEAAVDLAVGFRPREVEFDDAGTTAYVVTDDGISIIDLAATMADGAHVAAAVPVTADPLSDPENIEVEVTADGAHAVVREAGRAEVRIVALAGAERGTLTTIPVPAEPTDVDLLPGQPRAIAVLRDTAQLAVVDVPGDALSPEAVDLVDLGGELVGSAVVDATATRALLFTNATDTERVTVVELAAPFAHTTWRLEKGVRAAAFSPDGQTALVLHSKRPGDPGDTTELDEFIDRSYGYSLLDLQGDFDKLVLTPVDPGAFAFTADARRAYLLLDGGDGEGAIKRVQILDLATFVVTDVELGSPPEAVGILPAAGMAYVSQRHPLGRVTFLDLASEGTRTITGFELNSQIFD